MTKSFYRALAKINKLVLPSYRKRDLTNLKTIDKIIIGYRYWVAIRALP